MAPDDRTPVLVGAGQVTVPPDPAVALTERHEPVALMVRALAAAASDAGAGGGGLLRRADSLRVVRPVSWRYLNPGALVAERLGLTPADVAEGPIGGNTPLAMAAEAAADIAAGRADVVALVGGEALWTRIAARRDPDRPVLPWTTQPPGTPEPRPIGAERNPATELEVDRGLTRPTAVYPLFENARRAAAGETVPGHQAAVAGWWARFSEVAAANPYAWTRSPCTADEIATPGPDNRWVAFPYTKRMCANDRVDQGAALLLCSLGAARAAGVDPDRFVFPLAGAGANDHWFLSHRDRLDASPALGLSVRAALEAAGAVVDDVAHLDLYSCFPSAVEIAAAELGLDPTDAGRPLTATGGLAFAGGPVNNYTTHAVASLVPRLRADPGSLGLTTGVGWYLTKHAALVWSARPPERAFAWRDVQDQVDALPQRAPAGTFEGDGTVESYSVVCDRVGEPEYAVLAVTTGDGRRAWGRSEDGPTLAGLMAEEGCGRTVRLRADGHADLR